MKTPDISNEAVQVKTNKNWDEWFSILDNAGGKDMSHKDIVAFIDKNYEIDFWWQQTVTVAFEQARGLREKHEMVDGYQISKSLTINAPTEKAFEAWTNDIERSQWLEDPDIVIRKENLNKTLRVTWVDDKTTLDVYFYPKDDRVQVTLNHSKIPNKGQAEDFKEYWAKQLRKLKVFLESRS